MSKAKKPKPKRKEKPDFAQSALAAVERAIGGKLQNGTIQAQHKAGKRGVR
jgi:hypothetical protein